MKCAMKKPKHCSVSALRSLSAEPKSSAVEMQKTSDEGKTHLDFHVEI